MGLVMIRVFLLCLKSRAMSRRWRITFGSEKNGLRSRMTTMVLASISAPLIAWTKASIGSSICVDFLGLAGENIPSVWDHTIRLRLSSLAVSLMAASAWLSSGVTR